MCASQKSPGLRRWAHLSFCARERIRSRVAQVSNLPYRRFPSAGAGTLFEASVIESSLSRLEALRYSRLETCATWKRSKTEMRPLYQTVYHFQLPRKFSGSNVRRTVGTANGYACQYFQSLEGKARTP